MDRLVTCFFLGLATTAALHFTSAVHFNVQPADTVAMAGQSIVLQCALDEMLLIGENHHWIWTDPISGEHITLSTNRQIDARLDPARSSRLRIFGNRAQAEYNLRIQSLTKSDEGIYRCMLQIKQTGEYLYSMPATLTVEDMSNRIPLCVLRPLNPMPGNRIVLTCTAGSRFSTDVMWMLGGVRLQSSLVRQGDRMVAILRRNIYAQDNFATFTCLEGNTGGGSALQAGNCTVTPMSVPTTVTITPSLVTLRLYRDTTIWCHGESLPSATFYEWFVEGVMVQNSHRNIILADSNRRITITATYLQHIKKSEIHIRCTAGNTLVMATIQSQSMRLILPPGTTTTVRTPVVMATEKINVKSTREIHIPTITEYQHSHDTTGLNITVIPTQPRLRLPQKMLNGMTIISTSVLGIIVLIFVMSITVILVLKKKKVPTATLR